LKYVGVQLSVSVAAAVAEAPPAAFRPKRAISRWTADARGICTNRLGSWYLPLKYLAVVLCCRTKEMSVPLLKKWTAASTVSGLARR